MYAGTENNLNHREGYLVGLLLKHGMGRNGTGRNETEQNGMKTEPYGTEQ